MQVSLAVTVIGLFFLFFYAEEMEVLTPEKLDQLPLSKEVKLKGTISRLNVGEKATFITLEAERTETATVILFSEEDTALREGDYVEIVGTVEEYNGQKELLASKVVVK